MRPLDMRRSTAPATPSNKRTQYTAATLHGKGGQRRRRTAAPRHTAGCGPRPCSAPRPATAAPHDTSPANNNKAGGKEDILSSATGPSTPRCSKDVTTHQHRLRARPGRPCPVPAFSGQPLPGERRFSSALGNRVLVVWARPHGQDHTTKVPGAGGCLSTYDDTIVSGFYWYASGGQSQS